MASQPEKEQEAAPPVSQATDEVMDTLADSMAQSKFGATELSSQEDPGRSGVASTSVGHPRFHQYKYSACKDPAANQEFRRNKLLQHQRKRREEYVSWARALATSSIPPNDDEYEETLEDEEELEEEKEMDEGKIYRPKKLSLSYRNQLMLSEWLVDIPKDFDSKWLMVPVPVGQRSFVVASCGYAFQYSKTGKLLCSFPSKLASYRPDSFTVLDCIYMPGRKYFIILDIMMWNGMTYYECDTEFRFYWILRKLEEYPNIGKRIPKKNPFPFYALRNYACTKESLSKALNKPEMEFAIAPEGEAIDCYLDGLLFYHKDVHYLPGTTPLVGWLKGYMMPEMFQIPVSEAIMKDKPANYVSKTEFISSFDEAYKKKLARRIRHAESREKKERKSKHDIASFNQF